MSASNSFETAILALVLKNTTYAGMGDTTGVVGSSTAGSLYISLHTSDPGEAGDQTTNEATYTGYARVAVARSGSGWTVSGNSGTNAGTISFNTCTAGSNTITHFGVGKASTAAGELYFSGALTSSLSVSSGITPSFAASALTVTAD